MSLTANIPLLCASRQLAASLAMPACSCRCFHTSVTLNKNVRTGVPKVTTNRSKPLSYEEAQKPSRIFVTKYWNSINTTALHVKKEYERWLPRSSEVAVEDVFIRKFIVGTFQDMLLSEVVIKRRANFIYLVFLVKRKENASAYYFLKGYTESMLATILKSPIKLELQTVDDPKKLVFKKI